MFKSEVFIRPLDLFIWIFLKSKIILLSIFFNPDGSLVHGGDEKVVVNFICSY